MFWLCKKPKIVHLAISFPNEHIKVMDTKNKKEINEKELFHHSSLLLWKKYNNKKYYKKKKKDIRWLKISDNKQHKDFNMNKGFLMRSFADIRSRRTTSRTRIKVKIENKKKNFLRTNLKEPN